MLGATLPLAANTLEFMWFYNFKRTKVTLYNDFVKSQT